MGYNLFAYCKNNPIAFRDPTGRFGIVAGAVAVIAAGAIVGGLLGAFTAATTGGNVLESAIEGCITGALGASCGLLIGNPIIAVAVATIGGSAVDLAVQTTSQYITNKRVSLSEIDYGRVVKTGMQTGIGAAIPQYGDVAGNATDAFGTALLWAEASTMIAVADVVTTKAIGASASRSARANRTSTGQYVASFSGGRKAIM